MIIALLVFIPVIAFGAEPVITGSGRLKGSFTDGVNTIFGVLKISDLDDSQKNVFKNAMTSNRGIVTYVYDKYYDTRVMLKFIYVPDDVTFNVTKSGEVYTVNFSSSIPILTMNGNIQSNYPMYYTMVTVGNSSSIILNNNVLPSGWTTKIIKSGSGLDSQLSSLGSSCSLYTGLDYDGQIAIITDEQELEPEPEPEPEPVPPVIPEPEQPPLDFPDFPKYESKYIPYDTTVWNGFVHSVRSSIGSSTNIGFLLFEIILAIVVAISVIRKFTK